MSTEIAFLGSLNGTLNLNVFLDADPRIVGRVFLSLEANRIPGIALNGQFLLEINTSTTAQTIETFAVIRRG